MSECLRRLALDASRGRPLAPGYRCPVTSGEGGYEPVRYWSDRLQSDFNLRGTGHVLYSEAYNRWLYRAKRRVLHRALRHTGSKAPALDVGSGTGWVIEQLAASGAEVEGCDITPVAVERLQAQFPQVPFVRVAVGSERLPWGDARFQLVTAFDVLYHVTDDREWGCAVAEIARVLRPGGCLVITDGLGDADDMPAAHVHFRSLDRWTARAASCGLQVVTVLPYCRWLSRDRHLRGWSRVPDVIRGAVEYALEFCAPRPAHLRCAVLRRHQASPLPTVSR